MVSNKGLNVLVYGATGTQARPTVLQLIKRGHQPYILTRNAANAADLKAAGAHIIVADMADPKALQAASRGMDGVAFLLPTFISDPGEKAAYGRYAIEAARAANVNMLVWNTSGAVPDDDTTDPKWAVLEYLKASQLPYVLLEPTTYMENWLGPWTAPAVAARAQLAYPVLANRKMGWIACDDVGALVVAALERPALAGSRFKISGIEAPTGPQLAAIFSTALGRKISYYTMTPEEMGAVLDAAFGPGSGDNVAAMYRQEQNDPDPKPNFYAMAPVLKALPVAMTTIEQWVTAHAPAFS